MNSNGNLFKSRFNRLIISKLPKNTCERVKFNVYYITHFRRWNPTDAMSLPALRTLRLRFLSKVDVELARVSYAFRQVWRTSVEDRATLSCIIWTAIIRLSIAAPPRDASSSRAGLTNMNHRRTDGPFGRFSHEKHLPWLRQLTIDFPELHRWGFAHGPSS